MKKAYVLITIAITSLSICSTQSMHHIPGYNFLKNSFYGIATERAIIRGTATLEGSEGVLSSNEGITVRSGNDIKFYAGKISKINVNGSLEISSNGSLEISRNGNLEISSDRDLKIHSDGSISSNGSINVSSDKPAKVFLCEKKSLGFLSGNTIIITCCCARSRNAKNKE